MDEIVITPHDDSWPSLFQQEAKNIRDTFKGNSFVLEHIGSTAVPGLAAKPVIDMMLGFQKGMEEKQIIALLESLGYEHWKEDPHMHIRLFFVKWTENKTRRIAQIHVATIGGDFWRYQIVFRDILRANPILVREYAQLKQELAQKYKKDRGKYIAAKTDFVKKILWS